MDVSVSGVGDINTLAVEVRGLRAGYRAAVVVTKTAHDIEATAKQFVPVDTGATRNSIGVDLSDAGRSADIGPQTSYAEFLEFGTSRMAPRAFMGPALDRHTPDFIAALEAVADPFG